MCLGSSPGGGCLQDFLCLDRGITEQSGDDNDLIQFPLAGQALVMAYNLPALSATDPHLVPHKN
jgi:ABC-type phosphate transport system substrate-binding protein